MKQCIARIESNTKVAEGFYRMRLASAYLAAKTTPGQFVEVRCSDGADPLLRRPLGAHRILRNGIEMLYEVVGKGTELLSKKRPGDRLDIIGPLGNGFAVDRRPKTEDRRPVILVAGGIGVAPLLALAESIDRKPKTEDRRPTMYVLLGAKTNGHILCEKEFKRLGANVIVATEDGSKGKKGLVTTCLKSLLSTIDHGPSTIYACGPDGMLEAVWRIAKEKNIPCQCSFESRMACGIGVCLGCPIKIRKGLFDFEYKMVCKDGPVFNADEIAWEGSQRSV